MFHKYLLIDCVSFGSKPYGLVQSGSQQFVSLRKQNVIPCFKCLSEMLYGFVYFRDLKIENLLLDEDNNIKLIGMTFFFKARLSFKCCVVNSQLFISDFENYHDLFLIPRQYF